MFILWTLNLESFFIFTYMDRQLLNIGNYTFVCDKIDNSELDNLNSKASFVMLRNFKLNNEAIIDNDIYIVEEDLLDSIAYPIPNQVNQFSKDINNFFQLSNENIYKFFNSDHTEKKLKYDILKIYHPSSKVHNINMIVYLDMMILGIHFHLYCRPWVNHITKSKTEFRLNKSIYSEYIEIRIPNIRDLFSKDTFIKENTNFPTVSDEKYLYLIDKDNYMSTFLFTVPFTINGQNKKYLMDNIDNSKLTFIKYPINITLFPYSSIIDSLYMANEELESNSDVFMPNIDIDIQNLLGFNNKDHVVVKMNFLYPKMNDFESVAEAYEYYNGISLDEYNGIEYDEADEHEDIDADGNRLVIQYQFTYQLELSSDAAFKNIIYRSPLVEGKTLFNTIQNMEFEIPIFNNWNQLPEVLIARTLFSDRYLGIQMVSNFVLITKEWYKYLVTYNGSKEIYRLKIEDMADLQFNDKVTCIIKKDIEEKSNTNISSNNVKVIYKPVFYKVQDLQNIQIRKGVTQNIGVNLNNYLSKVNTFYMNIDGQQFIESARNEMYVIFKIQGNKINSNTGSYHISNQDNEYISSGNYQVI